MLKKIDLKGIDTFFTYEVPVRLVIMFFVGIILGYVFKDISYIFLGSVFFALILEFFINVISRLYSKKKNLKKSVYNYSSAEELMYSLLIGEKPENIIKLLIEDRTEITENNKIKETKINKILKSLLLNSIFKLTSVEEIEKLQKNPLILNNEKFLSAVESRKEVLNPEDTLIRKKQDLESQLIEVNEKLSKKYSISILRTE